LWVDEIIHPAETRSRIASAIATANHNPEIPAFSTGVLQV